MAANDLDRLRSYNYASIVFENHFPIIPYLPNCYALSGLFPLLLFLYSSKYHNTSEGKKIRKGKEDGRTI